MSIIDTSAAPIPGEIEQSLLKSLGEKPVKPRIGKHSSKCEGCGVRTYQYDKHHIIYEPAVIAKLCRSCHLRITAWNTKAVIILHGRTSPLTNVERVKIWIRFVKEVKKLGTSPLIKRTRSDFYNLRNSGNIEESLHSMLGV